MQLRKVVVVSMFSSLLLFLSLPTTAFQNYIYYSYREDGGRNIVEDNALLDSRFQGAQVVYSWKSLEPRKGEYDFSAIHADLRYLASRNKRLWIQLQEKSFSPKANVPHYIMQDAAYEGGVLRQSMLSAPERDPAKPLGEDEYGYVAKMWNAQIRHRFQLLIKQLAVEFDGKIEGINLSESSIEIGSEDKAGNMTFPAGFDPDVYVSAIEENMTVLASSFRQSTPMVYLNFLPGEWLPWTDKGYMKRLFAKAEMLAMGVGGPDLMPYRKSHMGQTYGFFRAYPDKLVKGMAVQDGNLRQINPRTGKKNTVGDILDFAKNYLGLDYIFWVEDEPFFTREVLRDLPRN